jgi:hypothetical protein
VTITDANASGTAYAIADTQNSITEPNEINNVTVGYPWQVAIDLQVVINSAVSDRNNVTVNYTVSNLAANPAGPFNVDVWSNSASAPAVGAIGESTATHASLAAGASATRTVTIANTSASGTAYAIVDTLDAVGEGIETNNVSLGKPWQRPPLAPLSFNFNDELLPADMVMSGNAAWAPATSGKGNNNTIFILKAGTITDGQTTCVALSAAMSSSVSFDYSVSSESGFDYLRFYIDGVQKGAWSGAVVWTASGLIAAGTTGLHEYKWCYMKDGVISSGSDTAWIDNIVIN